MKTILQSVQFELQTTVAAVLQILGNRTYKIFIHIESLKVYETFIPFDSISENEPVAFC